VLLRRAFSDLNALLSGKFCHRWMRSGREDIGACHASQAVTPTTPAQLR
jgi:hypothetical protein